MKTFHIILTAAAIHFSVASMSAQHAQLHVDPRWSQCSFLLDSSLTQDAFGRFTQEAGLVAYFRPLVDAQPMGAGKVELSILKWNTRIDEDADAWNNTFVHPDSVHWLIDGPSLPIPGLTLRAGLTSKLDAGLYWTMSPGANYGFFGGQLQYNFLDKPESGWASAARFSCMFLYGPEDVGLSNYGLDVLGSKKIRLYRDWLAVSPYLGASAYLAHAREKSDAVALRTENRVGLQASAGAVVQVSVMRLGVEYNLAQVNSFSFKLGVAMNLCKRAGKPAAGGSQ